MTDKEKLLTVSDVSRLSGVSVRTLRYYDEIGLLPPTTVTEAGYRLYDREALRRLQIILLYRELEFPLREISVIVSGEGFNVTEALERQIRLLREKQAHLEKIIALAEGIKESGVNQMDFSEFDVKKIEDYEAQAKERWGETPAYQEYEQKSVGRTAEDSRSLAAGLMRLFADLGRLRDLEPSDERVQEKIAEIQRYITEHYYTCTDDIFLSLGAAYGGGGSMQRNIDQAGGEGTGAFARRAIEFRCGRDG